MTQKDIIEKYGIDKYNNFLKEKYELSIEFFDPLENSPEVKNNIDESILGIPLGCWNHTNPKVVKLNCMSTYKDFQQALEKEYSNNIPTISEEKFPLCVILHEVAHEVSNKQAHKNWAQEIKRHGNRLKPEDADELRKEGKYEREAWDFAISNLDNAWQCIV